MLSSLVPLGHCILISPSHCILPCIAHRLTLTWVLRRRLKDEPWFWYLQEVDKNLLMLFIPRADYDLLFMQLWTSQSRWMLPVRYSVGEGWLWGEEKLNYRSSAVRKLLPIASCFEKKTHVYIWAGWKRRIKQIGWVRTASAFWSPCWCYCLWAPRHLQ